MRTVRADSYALLCKVILNRKKIGKLTSQVHTPVDAYAPIKDGTFFSRYCVFVWTDKNGSKHKVWSPIFINVKNLRFKQKRILVDGA